MEKIYIDKTAAKAVDDYLEYRRIVGEDDRGRLFSPEEYKEYKRTVLPRRMQNRLYVSFAVPGGIDCKLIGPETPCFCTHRYKQHQTDFEELPEERPIALPCRVRGCRCVSYQYVHLNGSQPVRCRCKHSAHEHSEVVAHLCKNCTSCSGFRSPYTCGCGQPGHVHATVVETREERLARGRPVGGGGVPYAAMGGLTGFSSLAEGYLRLDQSGAGLPPPDVLRPSGSRPHQEHMFERAYGPHTQTTDMAVVTTGVSDLRVREEEDMVYFEQRYQERLRMEKKAQQEASSRKPRRLPSQPERSGNMPDEHNQ